MAAAAGGSVWHLTTITTDIGGACGRCSVAAYYLLCIGSFNGSEVTVALYNSLVTAVWSVVVGSGCNSVYLCSVVLAPAITNCHLVVVHKTSP